MVARSRPVLILAGRWRVDHTTRTLLLQPQSGNSSQYLIVSRGSESNFDEGAGVFRTVDSFLLYSY